MLRSFFQLLIFFATFYYLHPDLHGICHAEEFGFSDPSEIYRTNPDFIVHDPTDGEKRPWDQVPRWNEHLLVQETKDGNLLAMWTSDTCRVGRSRSEDGGKTWSSAKYWEDEAGWQVPIIAPSGRVYVVYTQGKFHGGFYWRISDDHGRSWSYPIERVFLKTSIDDPHTKAKPKWICCTVPHFDLRRRAIIGYTLWAGRKELPGGDGPKGYSVIHLMRIENLHENPAIEDLQITWLSPEHPITAPHPEAAGGFFAQEPYLVNLPDQRMMMTFRTYLGETWYTISDAEGMSWRNPEPMRYQDNGLIIKNPVCPCPIFQLKRGDYLFLFCNNDGYGYGAKDRWSSKNRRPLYMCRGEFRSKAYQPIWWSSPPLLLIDNAGKAFRDRLEAASYVSLTEQNGVRVLWYPDRKAFLLGKMIPDEWLDSLKVDNK